MININTEIKFILLASRLNPTEDDIKHCRALVKEVSYWDYIVDAAIRNGIGPILHKNLPLFNADEIIPEKVKTAFQQTYLKNLSRNIIIYQHFREVISVFAAQGISVIALKGIYLADNIYQDIGLRQLSDIDLLIQPKDIEKAANVLIKTRYSSIAIQEKWNFNDNKDYGFVKGGVFVELHQHIHQPYEGFSVDIREYWERAKNTTIDGMEVLALSLEDMIQHLCIHLFVHFRKGRFSLTNFCDIAELLKLPTRSLNWKFLQKINNKYICTTEVGKILLLAKKYLGTEIPENVTASNISCSESLFESRFVNILQGNETLWKSEDYKMHYFRKARGLARKSKYLLQELFPMKKFMIRRYKIQYTSMFFLYYPYRIFSLISKGILFLIKKLI